MSLIPTQEPRVEWLDVVAAGFIYFGFLLFLVGFHIITINSEGNINTVLNYVFGLFITIFVGSVIFGLVGIIVQLARWLTWNVNTPEWKKKQVKEFNGKQ